LFTHSARRKILFIIGPLSSIEQHHRRRSQAIKEGQRMMKKDDISQGSFPILTVISVIAATVIAIWGYVTVG
jgi:hypothetical protein